MIPPAQAITSSTRRITPALSDLVSHLKPGQRIEVTQIVRVGSKSWPAKVLGVFRGFNYLATGLATERVPEDDIVVPLVHFTKDNGELSSVSLDENSQIRVVS